MKITKLNETHFKQDDKFYQHYKKHVADTWDSYFRETSDELFVPMSSKEYDNCADKLSKQKVSTSNIDSDDQYVGFVTNDGKIIKYGKLLNDLVVYRCSSLQDSSTITYYKFAYWRARCRYLKLLMNEYSREITEEDDKYNI